MSLDLQIRSFQNKHNISSVNSFNQELKSPEDLDAIVKNRFVKSSYPADITNENLFCPFCGKQVTENKPFSKYQSSAYRRNFLAHDVCLSKQSSIFLSDYFDDVEQANTQQYNPVKKLKPLSIGDRQFCLQLAISHPLSDYKFVKLVSKGLLNGDCIRWQLQNDIQQSCYLPNIICFPFVDFKVIITVSQIGSSQNKKIITNYINLSRNKALNYQYLLATSQNLNIQIKLHSSPQQKQKIIDQMNYKYPYRLKLDLPIVELVALQVTVPEQQPDFETQKNSTIVQLLDQKEDQTSFLSSYQSSMHSAALISSSSYLNHVDDNNNSNNRIGFPLQKSQKNISQEVEKIDLMNLIATKKLSYYVRNKGQSKNFEDFLTTKATNQQVQMIILDLYGQLNELVVNEYANYMMQKLFLVSLPTQKLKILSRLYKQMPSIVKNKQGTHTIQVFMQHFQYDQQYNLVSCSIEQEYQELCFHPISSHFIKKLINIFPLKHTYKFYLYTNQQFLAYAVDKNAMCVIKQMLLKFKELEDSDPQVLQLKRLFVNSITFNTDKIIQDCYGNYVIQFCYEVFGENKSSGVTQMIIEKFVQFSIQKYSSSVILKCVNMYWKDKRYVQRLKDSLRNEGILQMYRNQKGNRILLDLMDKNQNTPLREKIHNILASTKQPSKFYHDRWGVQIGIRSGPVGIQARSFGEAQFLVSKANKEGSNRKSRKK